MNTDNLIAIDTHTHLEVSCRNPFDSYGEEYDRAADKYFRSSRRPTMDETIAYYREKRIGFVNFTVDAETQMGRRRIPNEEIAEAAQQNSDIMIAFGSIDPHKGKMGAREARKLVEEYGVKGFKFHPTVQGFEPADRMAWPIYEVIAEHQAAGGLPQRPFGHRQRHALRRRVATAELEPDAARGRGDRLPRHADHHRAPVVAVAGRSDFAGDAQAQHLDRPVGLEPEVLSAAARAVRNTLLKDRILFGSDFPLITPDRWLKDFEEAGFKEEVKPLILKQNAMRLLKLGASQNTAA